MKQLFLFLMLVLPAWLFAQTTGSLNVFSENGDMFYLYLDGVKQNDAPRSNIRVEGLPDLYYSARIVFIDSKKWPVVKTNLYISDGDDVMRDVFYRIRTDKSGVTRMIFYSILPANPDFIPATGVYTYHFGQSKQGEQTAVAIPKDSLRSFGLGSLHLFSQNEDKFYLYLNGIKQNDTARSNLLLMAVPGLYYNARIVFTDAALPVIEKNNLFISDGDDILMEAAYRLRRDKTGRPRINFYSMKTVQPATISLPGMYVYNFGNAATSIVIASTPSEAKKDAAPQKSLITDIRITDKPAPKKSADKKAIAASKKMIKPVDNPVAVKTGAGSNAIPAASITSQASAEPGGREYSDSKKCNGWPMANSDLAAAKKTILAAGKDETMLQAAQDAIASSCLSTSQVAEFCKLFKSEKSKLAFAKYAYRFTIDKKNYSDLMNVLTLEASKNELNKFITGG